MPPNDIPSLPIPNKDPEREVVMKGGVPLAVRPAYQRFHDDPTLLVDTRWFGRVGVEEALHHLAVVDVTGNQAHLVTVRAFWFRHWRIPISSLLVERGAFEYIGTAEDFRWIYPGEWLTAISDRATYPEGPSLQGTWRIESVDSRDVVYVQNGRREQCTWRALFTYFRPATLVEREAALSPDVEPAQDFEEHVFQAPVPRDKVPPEEDPTPRTTAWERLNTDE
jgi:hypothetical protein